MSNTPSKRAAKRTVPSIRKNPSASAETKGSAVDKATDTAEGIDNPFRAKSERRPGRKIDASVIAGMAKLVARMLNESESCRRLGIKPKAWFDWKSRANRTSKFSELIEAYRADRIDMLIEQIEKSAKGEGVKYPDWRAALALLKITDQKRFGDTPSAETHALPVTVNVALMMDTLKRLRAERQDTAEIKPSVEVQALPPAASASPSGSGDAVKPAAASRVKIPVRLEENENQN